MSQTSLVLLNTSRAEYRTRHNAINAALASNSSASSAPSNPFAGQTWFNTSTGRMMVRNAANSAWLPVAPDGVDVLDSSALGSSTSNPASQRATKAYVDNAIGEIPEQVVSPLAGNSVILRNLLGSENMVVNVWTPHAKANVYVAGVVRLTLDYAAAGLRNVDIRLLKNGALVASWLTRTETAFTQISQDVSVAVGDLLTVEAKSNSSASQIRNIFWRTSQGSFAMGAA